MKWIHQLWIIGVVVCGIGLWGQLSLALADAKANPAPAWTSTFFWAWIVSPSFAWAIASFRERKSIGRSALLLAGTTISSLGGWWLIWRDSQARYLPGGMNPFAPGPGILMSLTVYPAVHWAFILGLLYVCLPLAEGRFSSPPSCP